MRTFESGPGGSWDSVGRWFPSEEERCSCCSGVRSPSRNYPYSMLKHCNSKKHYLELCKKNKVQFSFPKKEKVPIKEIKGFKVVIERDGILYSPWSLCNGEPFVWPLNKWVRQKLRWDWQYEEHPTQGLYFYLDEGQAMDYSLAWSSEYSKENDRVHIYSCTARHFQYVNKGKLVCSMLRIDTDV